MSMGLYHTMIVYLIDICVQAFNTVVIPKLIGNRGNPVGQIVFDFP